MSLFDAITQNNVTAFEELLSQADLKAFDDEGYTPLHRAVLARNKLFVEKLLEAGADMYAASGLADPQDFSASNTQHYSPLLLAGQSKDDELLNIFLMRDECEIDKPDVLGVTALMAAAIAGDAISLDKLLSEGADINIQDKFGSSALHWAVECGKIETAKALALHFDVEFDTEDENGDTAMSLAVAKKNKPMILALLECGDSLEATKAEASTSPLHNALHSADEDFVNWFFSLLKKKISLHGFSACLNKQDENGSTPLILAIQNGLDAFSQNLVETYGVNINACDDDDVTPLFAAIEANNEQMVLFLMAEGANCDLNKDSAELVSAIENDMPSAALAMLLDGVDIAESLEEEELHWLQSFVLTDITSNERAQMLRVATLENKECLKELLDEVKPTRELEKGADRDWMPGLKHAREKVAKVDTGDLLVIPGPSGRRKVFVSTV